MSDFQLSLQEVETLLESVRYSQYRIRESAITPEAVRAINLKHLDVVREKLSAYRRALKIEAKKFSQIAGV